MPPHKTRGRTPLSDYVREVFERSQMSKQAFVRACVDPQDPTRSIYIQWMDQLMEGRGPMPELWRLRALAVGTGADVEELKAMAAAQWLEYDVEEVHAGDDVIMIPVKGVGEATRRRIRQMAELMIEEAGG
mgnify:CR=1 FL=1